MKAKDMRLADLYSWASQKLERQNIPTIINHAIQRYKVKEPTARNYAIQIMVKLGKLSQPMKVSEIYRMWEQNVRDAEYYIKKLSRNEGIVCDPFLGSGTTGIAALKQNRKFIGIEKQEATFKIAEKRIKESINYQLSKWQ